MKRLIIAIDGFSSCGKSTMAKALARKLGYTYIDSGAMYRAITLYCIENGLIEDGIVDEDALKNRMSDVSIEFVPGADGYPQTILNGKNVEQAIRSLEVSNAVSIVSAISFVREALVDLQRKTAVNGGVVMDGRDIGTVVFPNADLKVFVTADVTVRAKRRYDELIEKGHPESFEDIVKNVELRDRLDQARKVSPLRKAEDAIILDNGLLNLDEQDAWLLEQVEKIAHGAC